MKSQRACWPAALGRTGSKEVQEEEEVTPSRPSRRFSGWWGSDAESGSKPDAASKLAPRTVSLLSQGLDLLSLRMASSALPTDEQAAEEAAPPPKVSHDRKRSWSITGTLGLGRKVAPQAAADAGQSAIGAGIAAPPPPAPSSSLADDYDIAAAGSGSGPTLDDSSAGSSPIALVAGAGGAAASPRKHAAGAGAGAGSPARGQGYRRLWQSITSTKKGEASRMSRAGGEVTVDELVRAVKRLGPKQGVMEGVEAGLACLDSRAVAALLKELAKAGAGHRATELFDALRALPPGAPLARLADLYTYTTAVSQCGAGQQLRRALELVAEMRARRVACNIHTYSALMGVCVKCGECDLALDVYRQALDEGLAPNAVTFNILVDVHGRAGRWREAAAVLDAFAGAGLAPESRTYNAVIAVCARAGAPDAAGEVYARMLAAGAAPSSTTYTSLISAYGKAGRVEEALAAARGMAAHGLEPNVITFSSLVCAAEKARRGDLALAVVADMRARGCRPNVVTYNALLGACCQANMWQAALDAFTQMRSEGCWPDAVSYSLLIAALRRGGAWAPALGAYEGMLGAGLRPDAGVLASLLGALCAGGLVAPARRAQQAYAAAAAAGHVRAGPASPGHWVAEAAGAAAARAAALHWLWGLRELLRGAGGASPTGASRLPPALAPEGLVLTVARGRAAPGLARTSLTAPAPGLARTSLTAPADGPARASAMDPGDSPAPLAAPMRLSRSSAGVAGAEVTAAVAGALRGLVAGLALPLAVAEQDGGVALRGSRAAVLAWLAGPGAELALGPVDAALASPPASAAALIEADAAAGEACGAAFAAVAAYEAEHFGRGSGEVERGEGRSSPPDAGSGSGAASPPNGTATIKQTPASRTPAPARAALAACILRLGLVLQLRSEVAHDAAQLAERLCRAAALAPSAPPAPPALAALATAAAQAGVALEDAPGWAPLLGLVGVPAADVAAERARLRAALRGDVAAISPLRVLQLYFERLGCSVQAVAADPQLHAMTVMAVEAAAAAAMAPEGPPALAPSLVAAACLAHARGRLGMTPVWPEALQAMTVYAAEDLIPAAQAVEAATAAAATQGLA